MVSGFWVVVSLGIIGGLLSELIRIAGAFKAGRPPKRHQYIASALYAMLGLGVLLYGWNTPRTPFEAASLGAAFPLLFTAGVRALVDKPNNGLLALASVDGARADTGLFRSWVSWAPDVTRARSSCSWPAAVIDGLLLSGRKGMDRSLSRNHCVGGLKAVELHASHKQREGGRAKAQASADN